MLCSISTKKPGSHWLDKLRSSKGFPFSDHHSLDQFLALNNDTNNNNSESSSGPTRSTVKSTETDNVYVVRNVLSELFCMGEESNCVPKFKCSRKQTNPRFLKKAEVVGEIGSGLSDDNSGVGVKQGCNVNTGDEEEEEDRSHGNLMGFTRSEVTVIDTSCGPWKFEKLLFRKKNVWKVRDKKGKKVNVGKRKRNADVADKEKKKQKIVSGHDGCDMKANDKLRSKDNLEETCKKASDSVGQSSKNRKLKASSSVVLIKSIPTSKKNVTSIGKNSLKPSQR